MPTYPGFYPYEGTFKKRLFSMKGGEAKDVGDSLSYENAGTVDELELAVTSDTIVAVYGDAPRTSGDSADADRMCWVVERNPTQLWFANVEAGTATAQTDIGLNVDLNSADGVDIGTTSNGDFIVEKVLTTATIVGYFSA